MITVVLTTPIKRKEWNFKMVSSPEISILQMRSPVIRDLFGLDLTDKSKEIENNLTLVSRLSGLSVNTLGDLTPSDFGSVMRVLSSTVNNGRGS